MNTYVNTQWILSNTQWILSEYLGEYSVNTQVFRAYDFPTPEENVAMYGREEPPEYKLEEVTCPVLLFWGQKHFFFTF